MADPFSAATSALTVVAGAAKLCETVYTLIQRIRSAPAQIHRLAYELRSTATVLHTLHHILATDKTIDATRSSNQRLVDHVFDLVFYTKQVLDEIATTVQPFLHDKNRSHNGGQRLGSFKSFVWEYTRKDDVNALVRTLESYKMTLTLACSSLQVFNDSQTHAMIDRVHLDVQDLFHLMQENKNDRQLLRSPSKGRASDVQFNERIIKYKVPLQRFLQRTSSVISLASEEIDTWSTASNTVELSAQTSLPVPRRQHLRGASISTSSLCPGSLEYRPLFDVPELDSSSLPAELAEPPPYSPELDSTPCRPLDSKTLDAVEDQDEKEDEDELAITSTPPGSSCGQRRPSSTYSFVPGQDDVLTQTDVAEDHMAHRKQYLSYLGRMSADTWQAHPDEETLQLMRTLTSKQIAAADTDELPTNKDQSTRKTANEDADPSSVLHVNGNSVVEGRTPQTQSQRPPKLSLAIPDDTASKPQEILCQLKRQSSRSSLGCGAQDPRVLPDLKFGPLDLSPLETEPEPFSTTETPSSISLSQLPDLDFGPEFTPSSDSTSPWNLDSTNSFPAPFALPEKQFRSPGKGQELRRVKTVKMESEHELPAFLLERIS